MREKVLVIVPGGATLGAALADALAHSKTGAPAPPFVEKIIAVDARKEPLLDLPEIRLPRERDHTAPRAPRKSFKKSSKR